MRFLTSLLTSIVTARPTIIMSSRTTSSTSSFPSINRGFNSVFRGPSQLTIGLVLPVENVFDGSIPAMKDHVERVKLAEELGFAAVWLRDVPFHVPSFGDAGQIYDPWVYAGLLAGKTDEIALGMASIVLPLRHPAHVFKAAASVDQLSGGRLLLGIASGDRPEEYPSMNIEFDKRSQLFRESYEYMRRLQDDFPFDEESSYYGRLNGSIDMIPKPVGPRLPMLITGGSRQDPEWIACHGDGWMTYARDVATQKSKVDGYRANLEKLEQINKPVMQPLYIDLVMGKEVHPRSIHLGYRCGIGFLKSHLRQLREIGVNHVALNLRFNRAC
jgi:luciferase-type oxidoreductase